MAFKQYKDAPIKESLTGTEKVYINDGNSFKQASIKDVVAKGSEKNDYLAIKKIKDYLFEIHYGVIDYGNAYAYFASLADPIDMGFCSAVRNGNWYGRNLDWIYDNNTEFIVHTPHIAGRCASLAVAGGFAELTNDFVTSEAYSDLYKLVPFRLYDGINEYGVIMNMNVVPTDNGTNVSLPTEQEEVTISAQMLIRYVLDNFKTANDAVEYIQKHMKIYFPISLHNKQYELHFMIADENNTYVVEFVDNAAVVFDATENSNSIFAGKPYMTNFYLNGVTLNDDGTVYTPGTQTADYNAKDTNGITDCGAGLERYNYIVDAYDSANTKDGMRAMMNGLKYTRTYSTAPDAASPVWLTEYVGVQGLTVISDPEDFDVVVQYAGGMFNDRSRTDGLTWQTVHSAVYDIENRALNIIVQEDGEELEFALDGFERKDNPEPVVLPPEVENAVATHGMGWTVSTMGEVVVEETEYTSDASGKICTTGLDIETPCVTYPNPGQMLCVCNGVECDVEVGYGHNDEYDENFYSMNITHDGEQVLYLWQLEGSFYVINGNTPQPNQTVDFVIYSVDNEVNQIAEKYMPEKVSNAIETGGLGWTENATDPIVWDGDINNTPFVEKLVYWDGELQNANKYYKISDTLSPEQLLGRQMWRVYDSHSVLITYFEDIEYDDGICGYSCDGDALLVFPQAGTFVLNWDDTIGRTELIVSEAGVYTYYNEPEEGDDYAQYVYKLTNEVYHQIDTKYLPGGSISSIVMDVENNTDEYSDIYPYKILGEHNPNALLMRVIDTSHDLVYELAFKCGEMAYSFVGGVDSDESGSYYSWLTQYELCSAPDSGELKYLKSTNYKIPCVPLSEELSD